MNTMGDVYLYPPWGEVEIYRDSTDISTYGEPPRSIGFVTSIGKRIRSTLPFQIVYAGFEDTGGKP